MRIEVDGGGFDSAAEAFFTGNQVAAIHYNSLVGKLRGYAAMAGDDKTSEDFVASYDTAAREAVGAGNDLVDGLATLGILTATSVENHRKANAGSVYGKPPPVYDGSGSLPEGPVDVAEFTPPSALGGDNADLPEFWNHVVDHLQGWTWPNADTGKLREAATAWKNYGDSVDRLTSYCDTAIAMFQGQKSPEIPLAIDAAKDFKQQITDAATEFRAIGQACSDYADQVENTREVIKGFLQDLAIEAGISVAVGVVVGLFTFGGGAAAGGGIAAWRAVACARKIIKALTALRAVRAVAAVANTLPKIRSVRTALAKFKNIKAVRASQKGVGDKLWTPGKFKSNPKNALEHFRKHKDEFPDCQNAKDYVDKARHFMTDPPPGTLTKVREPGGDIIRYDPQSNTMGIMDKDGTLKTMFKPDPGKHKHPTNLDYFHAQ